MQTAVERWQELIRARATQMDAAYARLGRTSSDFWDRRARSYHRVTRESALNDPLYLKVREQVTPVRSVLDVGAGTGRFALALAPHACHVTALEPNISMLSYLRQEAASRQLTNLTTLQCRWEDAPTDLRADIVMCSHVLYPILDIVPFVQKLRAAAAQTCYIYMRAASYDALTAPLWQHFHGDERQQPPGYIHALDVLYELGIYTQVETIKMPFRWTYPTLQDAEDELMEQLILAENEQNRRELRELLAGWLVQTEDQNWCSPPWESVVAILWWMSKV